MCCYELSLRFLAQLASRALLLKADCVCNEDRYELSVTHFPRYLLWVFAQEDMNMSSVITIPED